MRFRELYEREVLETALPIEAGRQLALEFARRAVVQLKAENLAYAQSLSEEEADVQGFSKENIEYSAGDEETARKIADTFVRMLDHRGLLGL